MAGSKGQRDGGERRRHAQQKLMLPTLTLPKLSWNVQHWDLKKEGKLLTQGRQLVDTRSILLTYEH